MKNIRFREDILPLKNVLYRLALRITMNREEAEDVVQDTMLKVWNRRDNWTDIDSIEAYCLTVCRNMAIDKTRKHGDDRLLPEQGEDTAEDHAQTPYERMMQKDRMRLVKRIVNALPEKQRSCLQLRDFEGKTYREIAQVLDISEEQVKVNIFRARQTVKQKYKAIDRYGL